MISFMALSGLVSYGLGGLVPEAPNDDFDDDAATADTLLNIEAQDHGIDLLDPAEPEPQAEIFDFARGDLITGFDPDNDALELEYSAAMGRPEITVTDFSDGTGASIALNGVVVADVQGAQGLDPADVILTAV